MSSITIKSNLASLGTQRRLGETTAELGRSFERLSSGLRINRASDDAAGLAISTSLSTDNRVFNQGIRNLNDGLSLLNVADGALSELSGIVIRIRELTEQSANGTLSNTQRDALDQEAQELSEEYTRIAQTTELNGLKLFDGSLEELSLQAGYGENGAVTSTLGGAIGDGTFGNIISSSLSNVGSGIALGDFNADGIVDFLTTDSAADELQLSLGNGDGTSSLAATFATGVIPSKVEVDDFNDDGFLDAALSDFSGQVLVYLGGGNGTFQDPVTYALSGNGTGDFTKGDYNGDNIQDLAVFHSLQDSVGVLLGYGDGTFQNEVTYSIGAGTQNMSSGDFNGDGISDIVTSDYGDNSLSVLFGNSDGTMDAAIAVSSGATPSGVATGDFNGDGYDDIASTIANDAIGIVLSNGDGSFATAISYYPGTANWNLNAADLNRDGIVDLIGSDNGNDSIKVLLGNGDGTFKSPVSYFAGNGTNATTVGDFNGDGVFDIAAALFSDDVIGVFLGNSTSGVGPILPFSLSRKADALLAMAPLDRKIEQLASQKGTVGAFQSRIETAINNLQITSTNVKAAESRIADIDTATESARLARLNILQQAGASVLAQANIQPQIALRLLGN